MLLGIYSSESHRFSKLAYLATLLSLGNISWVFRLSVHNQFHFLAFSMLATEFQSQSNWLWVQVNPKYTHMSNYKLWESFWVVFREMEQHLHKNYDLQFPCPLISSTIWWYHEELFCSIGSWWQIVFDHRIISLWSSFGFHLFDSISLISEVLVASDQSSC